jgi:hypothetical protein
MGLAYIQTCFGKQCLYLRTYTYARLVQEAHIHALMTIHAHCCLRPRLAVLCHAMFRLLDLDSLHHAQHALLGVPTRADAPSWGRPYPRHFMPATIGVCHAQQANHD